MMASSAIVDGEHDNKGLPVPKEAPVVEVENGKCTMVDRLLYIKADTQTELPIIFLKSYHEFILQLALHSVHFAVT